MKKTTIVLSIIGLILFTSQAFSQTTLTLQPNSNTGQDAEIWSLETTNNYGTLPIMRGNAWTWNGTPGVERAFVKFDMSSIPQGSQIINAQLFLYGGTDSTQYDTGNNITLLQRVTSAWDQSTVTWGNQPPTTTVNEVTLPASTSDFEDYPNINVTNLVQDMVNNPDSGYGFMIRLQDETTYTRIEFSTSNDPDSTKHPKLVITYSAGEQICKTFKLNPEGKDAEIWNLDPDGNYGTYLELKANAWTWNGTPGIQRALFDFGLSSTIPANSNIVSAQLSLHHDNSDSTQFDSPADGSNACWLQRVTSAWEQNSVTWNNQPSSTNSDEDSIPMSTSLYQDYLNINVTNLVQDMVNNPTNSFGFLLSLVNENYYRRMTFASGNNPDTSAFPTLTVCYTIPEGINEINKSFIAGIYPNPCNDYLVVQYALQKSTDVNLSIINTLGQLLWQTNYTHVPQGNNQIIINGTTLQKLEGIYYLRIKTPEGEKTIPFVKSN